MDTSLQLPAALHEAAHALGQALRAGSDVSAYLEARARCDADASAVDLERRLASLYEELIARQQAGETLSQEARTAFYNLRRQVQTHPNIVARDEALAQIKPILADAAAEISAILEVDYTALAR
ncbi:MAG: YlbF family regulator [Anaerolineae bacterium]